MPPQTRIVAMASATAAITTLAIALILLRVSFGSILRSRSFVAILFEYLPGGFYAATFYVAIVTGVAYAVHSWAIEEERQAAEAELDAAIARAELNAAAGRLQPEWLDPALARLASLMATNPAAAQQLISDLGAMLHESLTHPESTQETPAGTHTDERMLTLR